MRFTRYTRTAHRSRFPSTFRFTFFTAYHTTTFGSTSGCYLCRVRSHTLRLHCGAITFAVHGYARRYTTLCLVYRFVYRTRCLLPYVYTFVTCSLPHTCRLRTFIWLYAWITCTLHRLRLRLVGSGSATFTAYTYAFYRYAVTALRTVLCVLPGSAFTVVARLDYILRLRLRLPAVFGYVLRCGWLPLPLRVLRWLPYTLRFAWF